MPATNQMFGPAVENMFKGQFDLSEDVVKVALFSAYVFNEDHASLAQIKAAGTEASGTGYSAGGATLTHGTADAVTYADGIISFGENAEDTEWESSTITASFAVVYVDAATDAERLGLCVIDFDGEESSVDGTFKIDWHQLGIFRATANPSG